MGRTCDLDCLNCPFPDFIVAEMDADERRAPRAMEMGLLASPGEKRYAAHQKAYREANREKIAAYQKAYYEANREKIAAYQKAYREANREKLAAYQKAYREANREKLAAYQKAFFAANREKFAVRRKAYYEANREKIAAYQKAYREKFAVRRKAYYEANREKHSRFGQALRAARKKKGYSLTDLGRFLGVSMQAVSQWELGMAPLPKDKKEKLSVLLPELLLETEDWEENKNAPSEREIPTGRGVHKTGAFMRTPKV